MKSLACFCLASFTLLLSACGKGNVASTEAQYHIVPGEPTLLEGTVFSDLLTEYRYIVPETTEESLFAYISKAYIDRECLYILDSDRSRVDNKVLVFDVETGKFLRAIGSQGRGPNEYLYLSGFTLDRERRELLVADSRDRKVIVYDADSGAFKRGFDVGFYPSDIEYLDESTLAFAASGRDGAGGHYDRLQLTDMEGRTLGSWIPYNDKNGTVVIKPFSRGDGNELVFRTSMTDSLHTVTPRGPVFSRFVDFGADALTWNIYKTFPRSEQTGLVDDRDARNYKGNIRYWSETGGHIWFVYFDKTTPVIVLYNKKSGGVLSYGMEMVNNIVFDKMPLMVVASDGDWFIGTNDAFSIVENIAGTAPVSVPDDLKNLKDNSNPVITLVKFK